MSEPIIQILRDTYNGIWNVLGKFYENCRRDSQSVYNKLNEYSVSLHKIYNALPEILKGLRSQVYGAKIAVITSADVAINKVTDSRYKWDDADREVISDSRQTIRELGKDLKKWLGCF